MTDRLNPLASRFLNPHRTRFGGYAVDQDGVTLTLPGHAPKGGHDGVSVEYHYAGHTPQHLPMVYNSHQWQPADGRKLPLKKDLYYRFVQTHADGSSTTIHDLLPNKDGYNRIPAGSKSPSSLGNAMLVFRDSLVTPDKLSAEPTAGVDSLTLKRTHHNRLGGNEKANAQIKTLYEQLGIAVTEDRPLIGGDDISAHGYWTNTLFHLNNKVSGSKGFENLAIENLKNGSRMRFDGAFVNEGFQGVHYLANLYYGANSPFINGWFDYGSLNQFPHQPLDIGVLPVKKDPATGDQIINNNAWDVRFVGPVNAKDPEGPYWVELYDPRLEDASGKTFDTQTQQANLLKDTGSPFLASSQDSVQPYRFPVSNEEYRQKQQDLKDLQLLEDNPSVRSKRAKSLKAEWKQFRLTSSIHDRSGYNWDGQRDVKKLNVALPEVREYITGACRYWTDKVDRLYSREIAKALSLNISSPAASAVDYLRAIDAETQTLGQPAHKIIPALNGGETNPVSLSGVTEALKAHSQNKKSQKQDAGLYMGQTLARNFRPETLPAPKMLQMVFHTPAFRKGLDEGIKPLWLEASTAFFRPLMDLIDRLLPESRPMARLVRWLTPKSFYTRLGEKLEGAMTPTLKQKLADPALAHLVHEQVGRSVLLSVLTGQQIGLNPTDEALNPQSLAKGYQKAIPAWITRDLPPQEQALHINRLITQKLDGLDIKPLLRELEAELAPLSGEAVAVARYVIQARSLGLSWRIDALKDLGDMDAVRSLTGAARVDKLTQELDNKVQRVMTDAVGAIRSVNPASEIIAEITDLGKLAGNDAVGDALTSKLMASGLYSSVPNYRYLFSSPHKMVGMSFEPEAYPPNQLGVSEFIQNNLKPMLKSVSAEQAMMFQNMVSNHDKSTALFWLTLHPFDARYDYLSWFGIHGQDGDKYRGVLHLALSELANKPQIKFLAPQVDAQTIERFRSAISQPEFMAVMRRSHPELSRYETAATPFDMRDRYLNALFETLDKPELAALKQTVNLSDFQRQQLTSALKQLLNEPSEAKSMRGKLTNCLSDILAKPQRSKLPADATREQALQKLAETFVPALWNLAQQIPLENRRWFGYQQLDKVIDWGIEAASQALPDTAVLKTRPEVRAQIKQALYNQAVGPALEQYKRIVALQVALPGSPTLYLPDLLGQAGGEDLKNMFLGNREAIRYDWIQTNPMIQRFVESLAPIVRQRRELHALNNGFVYLPLDPERSEAEQKALAGSSVLPVIRDNGKDQILCLVNMGAPADAWNSWMDAQKTDRYPEIRSQKPALSNYQLSLDKLGIAEGTRYQSTDQEGTGETYRVNGQGQLINETTGNADIKINIYRTLKRL